MDILFFIVSLALLISSARKGFVAVPISMASFFLACSSLVFILVYYEVWSPEDYFGLAIPYTIPQELYWLTYVVYLPILIPLVVANAWLFRKKNKRVSFQDVFLNRAAEGRIRKLGLKYGVVPVFVGYSFIFFHAFDIDWRLVWANSQYLLLVVPGSAGISNVVASIAHNSLAFIGVIFAFLIPFFVKNKKSIYVAFLVFAVAYVQLIKLAQFSRWAPIIFGVLMASYVLFLSGERRWWRIKSSFMVAVVWYSFIVVVQGRSNALQGVVGVVDVVFSAKTYANAWDSVLFSILNVFGGFFITAHSLGFPTEYSSLYKALSFSPLPGALDGWGDVVGQTGLVNGFTPFNGAAELYQFGIYYTLMYVIYLYVCLYVIVRAGMKGYFFRFILTSLCFFVLTIFFQFYPIRNSIKLMTLALIIVSVVSLFSLFRRASR